MKIQLKRTGGLTGIPFIVIIDTEELDPEDKNTLEEIVESAHFSSLPEKIDSASWRLDQFLYRITIDKLDSSHTIEVSESGMPESLQQFIQRVTFLGRSKPNP